jgi:hypothetical protein
MSFVDWIFMICVVGWLCGVGLLAHAVPVWLRDPKMPDIMRIGISMFPERVALAMAVVVVSWPMSMPVLIVMSKARDRKEG